MKDMKRALRRHHRQRMIAHAMRICQYSEMTSSQRRAWALLNYNHLAACSCYMCGHQRKWYGPTMQERRWNPRERIIEVRDEEKAMMQEIDS